MSADVSAELSLLSRTPQDTRRLAAALAGSLHAGDVVALTGELGAGKTCFVQGAAAALGVTDRVTSPSFLLCREYRGTVPVRHMDVYRLDRLSEVVEAGYDEALDGSCVTFIEWGDAMSPLLPREHLEVEFRLATPDAAAPVPAGDQGADDAEERHILVRPRGEGWLRRATDLDEALRAWAARPGGEATSP